MKKTTLEWFNSAQSDLLLIQQIEQIENLTHLSAFHSQQSIEKSFKAVIEEFNLGFVKTHSLEMLYDKVKARIIVELNTNILIVLDQLYIDARYPGELGLLPNGRPTISEGNEFYKFAIEVFEAAKFSCDRH
jgi:HEPN domain-containing protein